ncbi:MAG: regulatory protein RecX [Bacteroidota bacterium]
MSSGSIPVEYQTTYFKIEQYCASQEHCAFDVKRKLNQQNIPFEITEQIIEKLLKTNFINHDRYCEAFTNDHVRIKKWGKLKIKAALKAKFLPSVSITNAIQHIDNDLYYENLKYLLARKKNELANEKDLQKKKAKLVRYLASNGYESDLIFDIID